MVMSRVSPPAHDNITVLPRAANWRSESLKKFSSNRRYVLTIAILRPRSFSQAVIAVIRPGSVRCSGRTQAPRYDPFLGGATGPAWNGPSDIAMDGGPASTVDDGAAAGGCSRRPWLSTVRVTAAAAAR